VFERISFGKSDQTVCLWLSTSAGRLKQENQELFAKTYMKNIAFPYKK
jgi:hypothetical protein